MWNVDASLGSASYVYLIKKRRILEKANYLS